MSSFQNPSNIVQRLSVGDVERFDFRFVMIPILCHDYNFDLVAGLLSDLRERSSRFSSSAVHRFISVEEFGDRC